MPPAVTALLTHVLIGASILFNNTPNRGQRANNGCRGGSVS